MPKLNQVRCRFSLHNARKGKANILMTFVYGGKRLRAGIGQNIKVSQWDKRNEKPYKIASNFSQVNKAIELYTKSALSVYNEFGEGFPLTDFKKELKKAIANDGEYKGGREFSTLVTWAEYYYDFRVGLTTNKASLNLLAQTLRYLRKYKEFTGSDVKFEKVNDHFAISLRSFLERPEHDLNHNTVRKVLKGVVRFMKEAGSGPGKPKHHNSIDYTSDAFKMKEQTSAKFFLNLNEIDKLLALDLAGDALEKTRDLFAIGCYTGLRWSDYSRLTPKNFQKTSTGEVNLKIRNQKTKKWVVVPILPKAVELLEKYSYKPKAISPQKFNDYVKVIGKRAGLIKLVHHTETRAGREHDYSFQKWEKLTSHTARRSFATNSVLAGISRTVIMQITGHRTESAFNRYICMDGEENADQYRKEFESRWRNAV